MFHYRRWKQRWIVKMSALISITVAGKSVCHSRLWIIIQFLYNRVPLLHFSDDPEFVEPPDSLTYCPHHQYIIFHQLGRTRVLVFLFYKLSPHYPTQYLECWVMSVLKYLWLLNSSPHYISVCSPDNTIRAIQYRKQKEQQSNVSIKC